MKRFDDQRFSTSSGQIIVPQPFGATRIYGLVRPGDAGFSPIRAGINGFEPTSGITLPAFAPGSVIDKRLTGQAEYATRSP